MSLLFLCVLPIERLQVTSRDYVIYFRVAKRRRCKQRLHETVKVFAMVRSCCAHNCTARDVKRVREAGVQFYRFPQNEAKRTLWVNAVNRKDFHPNASTVICSQHFVGGKYF